ncbi:hypothetical protein [Metabacillus fastidiosus]|uniref:Histidine kinase n=1 Tax=Metabacillus fastidiosus TaxID=1458 RepID=A0ABU6NSR1_9BACI|nr:hypothetical protein [Metabacillus fastidiosus]MED4455110.1 hypothetical protein [Metabacillus fastidiosus]
MNVKRLKVAIPVTIVVAALSLWILEKDHSAVPLTARILIAAGGALLSGVIAFFLLQGDADRNDSESR